VSSPYNPQSQGGEPGGYGQPYQPYPQGSDPELGSQRSYLQGGPVGFGEAISQAFRNLTTFNGRASRSAYWWFALFLFIIAIVLDIVGAAAGTKAIQYAVEAVVFLLSLALQVRRLHDINRTGFWWFIGLIPLIGTIVLIIFDCQPGTPGPNRFD
jgi:uncharacterized membrane protein YhaH (DUF805 family)